MDGRGYLSTSEWDYRGQWSLDKFQGYGIQTFHKTGFWREGFFYAGKFIKGIQHFGNYSMQGTFAFETQRTKDTILKTTDRIMVGRAGEAKQAKIIDDKVQASTLDSGRFEQGEELTVEWR